MVMPCDCCSVQAAGCALVGVQFSGVTETVPQAGWNQVNLAATADGITATATLSGYNTAVGNTPSAALQIEYALATPQNRVRGVRLWNQAGSDLNDADGLNHFTAEFYAGAVLLTTATWQVGNGGAPQSRTLPNGLELNGVTSVVLRTLDKQIGGSVAPLWREFQLLEFQPVFSCRRRSGVLEWYDTSGNLVANGDVQSCETPPQPWVPTTVVMNTSAFGDDPSGTAENMCNVVPAPSAAVGWAAPSGGCYDPTSGTPSFTWGPTSSVEMEYGDNGNGQPSGAAFLSFTAQGNLITWPTSAFVMEVGDTIVSNLIPGGRRAVLTYISGPPASNGNTLQPIGGATLRIHGSSVSVQPRIRFRLDFITA